MYSFSAILWQVLQFSSHHLTITSCPFDRGSGNEEEEAQLDDVPSDDDIIMSHSSDEEDEDDGSSTSSKGDSEQPQARAVRRKLNYILTAVPSCAEE